MTTTRLSRRAAAALLCAIAAAVCAPVPALAAVTCAVSSTPLAFGSFSSLETGPHDTIATITVSCSSDSGSETATYDVALDGGNSGSTAVRKMASGSDLLSYNIYSDLNHAMVWGTGSESSPGSLALNNPIETYSNNHAVYGRIEAGQANAPIGSYSDLVTITLSY